MNITSQQIAQVCASGVKFLSLETTLVPGNLRADVAVLESVLGGIAAGRLTLTETASKKPARKRPTPKKGK